LPYASAKATEATAPEAAEASTAAGGTGAHPQVSAVSPTLYVDASPKAGTLHRQWLAKG
jgi:hypothetical protein